MRERDEVRRGGEEEGGGGRRKGGGLGYETGEEGA